MKSKLRKLQIYTLKVAVMFSLIPQNQDLTNIINHFVSSRISIFTGLQEISSLTAEAASGGVLLKSCS